MILSFEEYEFLKENENIDNDVLKYILESISESEFVTEEDFIGILSNAYEIFELDEGYDFDSLLEEYSDYFEIYETENGNMVLSLNEAILDKDKVLPFNFGKGTGTVNTKYRSLTQAAKDRKGAMDIMKGDGKWTGKAKDARGAFDAIKGKKSFLDKAMGTGSKMFKDYNKTKTMQAKLQDKTAKREEKAKRKHELAMIKAKGKYGMR